MRKLFTWALWLLLILAVVGVGYYAWRYLTADPEPPAGEQVTLVCGDECEERGQCGTSMGEHEAPVILGGKDGPVVEPQQHDVFFLADTSVEVKDSMMVTLQEADGREFEQSFSRVQFVNPIGDIAETGWVAEWCIVRQ